MRKAAASSSATAAKLVRMSLSNCASVSGESSVACALFRARNGVVATRSGRSAGFAGRVAVIGCGCFFLGQSSNRCGIGRRGYEGLFRLQCGWFKQIPFIAVEVFEDGDGAVGFDAGRFEEPDAVGAHGGMVAVEIVSVKKKKDAAAGLISH